MSSVAVYVRPSGPLRAIVERRFREMAPGIIQLDGSIDSQPLEYICRDGHRFPTCPTIIKAVCKYYGLTITDMFSNRRMHRVVYPRQNAMYLARKLTLNSLPEIGRRFGNRDHTTVLHAVRAVEHRRANSPELDAAINEIEREIMKAIGNDI